MNLIVDLWCHNGLKIKETELVKRMYALQAATRGTRQHLAAAGVTDLSTITDATEPETTYDFNPPTNRATSLSAADRKARLSAYMPTFGKSVSPLRHFVSTSDANNPKNDGAASPQRHAPVPASPIRTGTYGFEYSTGTSSGDNTVTSLPPTTPARNVAAATPSALRTPRRDPVDLSASLRASGHCTVQTTPKSWKKLNTTEDVAAAFNFAGKSCEQSAFIPQNESMSFIKPSSRRRSEPLLQSVLKDRTSRASLPPQMFFGADQFDNTVSTNHASPARTTRSSIGSTFVSGELTAPLGPYFKPRPGPSPVKEATPTTPGTPLRYEIYCSENPDIFGKKTPVSKQPLPQLPEDSPYEDPAASPHQSPAMTPAVNEAVKDLATLAQNYCGSEAKVFVTQEEGKLKVRFKLPTKYANLFPGNQGTETSHFSSELEMPHSPRIRFPPPQRSRQGSPERMSPARKALVRGNYRQPLTGSPLRDIAATFMDRMHTRDEQPDAEVMNENTPGHENTNCDAPSAGQSAMAFDFATASERRRQLNLSSNLSSFTSSMQTPTQRPAQTPLQQAATPAFAPSFSNDETLVMHDFDSARMLPPSHQSTAEAEQQPVDASIIENTSILTPTAQLQREAMEAPGSTVPSELNFTPTFATPTSSSLAFTPSITVASAGHSRTPNKVQQSTLRHSSELGLNQSFATPTNGSFDATNTKPHASAGHSEHGTESPNKDSQVDAEKTPLDPVNHTPQATEAETFTPLKSSFTPVNKPATQRKEVITTTSEAQIAKSVSKKTPTKARKADTTTPTSHDKPSATKAPTPKSANEQSETEAASGQDQAAVTTTSKGDGHYEDNRDYLIRFMQSAKPKKPRSSTTDNGSPISSTTSRPPLGVKSPNASPSPRKRKNDENEPASSSPIKKKAKKMTDTAPKGPKRPAKGPKKTTTQAKQGTVAAVDPYEVVDEDMPTAEANEQSDKAPSRRSTRIRAQPAGSNAPKSSIPTPIKVSSRAGAGRGNNPTGMTSGGRNEQAELTRKTAQNTKRNKFKAESVQDTLARVSEELKSGSEGEESEVKSKPSQRGNNVAWDPTLVRFQTTPQENEATGRGKATLGKTGVSKPKGTPAKKTSAASSTVPKGRSQAAKKLGMAANGTPAKPATRARTRSQH